MSAQKEGRFVVVRLMGGLGNQMFQYAFGLRLSLALNVPVKFDTLSGFQNDVFRRTYSLDSFSVAVNPAGRDDVPFGLKLPSPWSRLVRLTRTKILKTNSVYYEESPFAFDHRALCPNGSFRYYFGYWQNLGYSESLEETLRLAFRLKRQSADFVLLAEEMRRNRSIAIHVRRYHDTDAGGKVISKALTRHGASGANYFQRALEAIGATAGTMCYIFSDDLLWAKENLKLDVSHMFVADKYNNSAATDLALMTQCHHHVISNSSFSWWGARLAERRDGMVVAPKEWMRIPPVKGKEVCPATWILM